MKSGDVIAEIETDKATMEVEAVDEGRLDRILVAEGTEGVAVNTPIATLAGGSARQVRRRRQAFRPGRAPRRRHRRPCTWLLRRLRLSVTGGP